MDDGRPASLVTSRIFLAHGSSSLVVAGLQVKIFSRLGLVLGTLAIEGTRHRNRIHVREEVEALYALCQ